MMFKRSKVFAASLVLALPLCAAGPARAQTVLNMACKLVGDPDVSENLTIDLNAKSISAEASTPNPGGSPDPSIARWSYTDPAMRVSDQSIDWSQASNDSHAPSPTLFSLNRYTGNLHQTRQRGGFYPNGQDITWARQPRQKQF